jgi:Disulphide bond corrector protein DsbC
MRTALFFLAGFLGGQAQALAQTQAQAQTQVQAQAPLHWQYSARKLNDSLWAVHFTAMLDPGWHAYSQTQPESAVAEPTRFHFNANPLLRVKGKTRESGDPIHFSDPGTGIAATQYSGKVDFVQDILLKSKAITNFTGTITFQTCTDEMCLPPKTIAFSIGIP